MANELQELIEEIQFRHKLTLNQIAARIGYSRPYLNNIKLKGGNENIQKLLLKEFPDILQKVSRETPDQGIGGIVTMTASDRISELLKDKETLRDSIQLSLNSIQEGQGIVIGMLKTGLEELSELKGRLLHERQEVGKKTAENIKKMIGARRDADK